LVFGIVGEDMSEEHYVMKEAKGEWSSSHFGFQRNGDVNREARGHIVI
jgi:hypothetical protein